MLGAAYALSQVYRGQAPEMAVCQDRRAELIGNPDAGVDETDREASCWPLIYAA